MLPKLLLGETLTVATSGVGLSVEKTCDLWLVGFLTKAIVGLKLTNMHKMSLSLLKELLK